MFKKLVLMMVVLIVGVVLASCKEVTLNIDTLDITIKEGETYQIEPDISDGDVSYVSSDTDILTVSDNGLIEALSEGETTVVVTSLEDADISLTITVTILKAATISVEFDQYEIKIGDTLTPVVTTNDDVTYESLDEAVFTVDQSGLITGVAEGEADLKIVSNTDDQVYETVTITVKKVVELTVFTKSFDIWVNLEASIEYDSNDDVRFEVSDSSVVSVTTEGVILGLTQGTTTIEVISTYDETVKDTITVNVYLPAESIIINGQPVVNLNQDLQLTADIGPDHAYEFVSWASSDEGVAVITEDGLFMPMSTGEVTITAVSLYDDSITATYDIEVVFQLAVDPNKSENDTLSYEGIDYTYGVDLFATINDALAHTDYGVTILVFEGTYQEDLTLSQDNMTILGIGNAIIDGHVTVANSFIALKNLTFTGDSTITNTVDISNFLFYENESLNITSDAFINLDGIEDLEIGKSTFSNMAGDAIVVKNYKGGTISINQNTIDSTGVAVWVESNQTYDINTKVEMMFNTISSPDIGIKLLNNTAIQTSDVVRFNSVSTTTGMLVQANSGHQVDFTLNYWGTETPVYEKFFFVSEHQLRGFYGDHASMPTFDTYDPLKPLKLIPNTYDIELVIGESYQVSYELLPKGVSATSVKFITSDANTVTIATDGTLNLVRSGSAYVTLLLGSDYSVNARINISIITTPGVEITPSITSQSLVVGDSLSLDAFVFPYTIEGETVLFTSSDSGIASINQDGVINSYTAGVVTFTAVLASDEAVKTTYTVEFYQSLDSNNLLDLLTLNQLSYTPSHIVTAYGVGYNYTKTIYESVSKYYFGDIDINQSKMIPVSNGIRPGEPMDPNPEGVTQYNPENVYWIVVHDTANTSTGAGALAHANYLWNAAAAGTELWASWHFSIDDLELYQHIPTDERAYHAGDGSSLPLQGTTYLGGGNRNGIGIETGVNDDADLFRTWQRTAKLAASLMEQYNLPRENMKYHNDFSGKDCPKTLRNAGLIPLFETLEDIEYIIATEYQDAEITLVSNNTEYVDNTGRIIAMPDRAMTVSYTISITLNGVTTSRDFYTYLPGTVH